MPAATVAALVAELRESPADHCRGDAQLLPPARPRGTRASDTRACDGRLQRRTLRHFPCAARTQHWQRAKVTSARENPLLWNLMWPIAGAPDVSLYFDNQPNMLDQFMVNKNMATGDAPSKADPATARILKPPAMVNPGFYPNPVRRNGQAGQSERNPTISQSRSESPRSTRPAVTSPSVWLTWNYTRPRSAHRRRR
jgi:hypothetical protein